MTALGRCTHSERTHTTYRAGTERHVYWLCQRCGQEWTTSDENMADLTDAVTSDELIDLHSALEEIESLRGIIDALIYETGDHA